MIAWIFGAVLYSMHAREPISRVRPVPEGSDHRGSNAMATPIIRWPPLVLKPHSLNWLECVRDGPAGSGIARIEVWTRGERP